MKGKKANKNLHIIEEIRFGSQESISILYYKYNLIIIYFCMYRSLKQNQCSIVIKQIFIKIISTIHGYDEAKTPFISWFIIFIRNIILKFVRKNQDNLKQEIEFFTQFNLI